MLAGAIPIVSSRWNGASEVDFPGVIKVDHQNATAVSAAIAHAFAAFDERKLIQPETETFFEYISSMEESLETNADVYFGPLIVSFFVYFS